MNSQPRLIQTYLADGTAFKSPNHAGHMVTGRAVNAWTTWKNSVGQTMDEVMRGE